MKMVIFYSYVSYYYYMYIYDILLVYIYNIIITTIIKYIYIWLSWVARIVLRCDSFRQVSRLGCRAEGMIASDPWSSAPCFAGHFPCDTLQILYIYTDIHIYISYYIIYTYIYTYGALPRSIAPLTHLPVQGDVLRVASRRWHTNLWSTGRGTVSGRAWETYLPVNHGILISIYIM